QRMGGGARDREVGVTDQGRQEGHGRSFAPCPECVDDSHLLRPGGGRQRRNEGRAGRSLGNPLEGVAAARGALGIGQELGEGRDVAVRAEARELLRYELLRAEGGLSFEDRGELVLECRGDRGRLSL